MATKEELEKIKRRSAAYWKKRSKELEEASFNRGMRTYRDIEEAFNQAQRSIDKEIEKWYHRIAENNDLTLDGARKLLRANELEEFKWDVKEYIKAGKENAVNQSWMKELENASGRYHISRLEALKIETQQALELAFGNEVDAIDKMARRTIDEDYLKTCYELQKGIGVGWPVGTIDNRTLDKIVTKPWAADGANFSDRIWTNKTKMVDTLHQNLTRACILGQSPDKAIAALTQFVDKSISNAKRAAATLVQTEQAYFHARAQQEAYTAIGVEEFEVVATLDSHTSEICQEMDGEHFPMSQYEIGTTVPPFHPRCRSVTAPYFEDDFGVSGQRAARGDDADATYYVPENMTYKEWKEEQKATNGVDTTKKDLYTDGKNVTTNIVEDIFKDSTGYADENFDRKLGTFSRDQDLKAVNPYYSKGKESGYQTNCQRCCPTYLLRRQGYDVIANPDNFGHDKGVEFILHRHHRLKYIKADGSNPVVHFTRGSKTHGKDEIEQFMSNLPDGALCEISCAWNPRKVQGGGHVFLAQKENGVVKYIDPQTGDEDVSHYFDLMIKDKTDFIRIDDTRVNENYIWFIAGNKR